MIKENIVKVKGRIISACLRVGRDPAGIKLIVVSKGRSAEEIKEALFAGITDIAENRVQEAAIKYKELTTNDRRLSTIKWHMVGHLQSNKAKDAVKIFDLIHSVDSMDLVGEINKQAARINKVQEILLEVKTSPEETKFGIKPDELTGVIREVSELKNINIMGLMTIAPLVNSAEEARPYFKRLSELKDKINRLRTINYELRTLSMGMTDDFEVAIEEGSNIVRIGRAIFES